MPYKTLIIVLLVLMLLATNRHRWRPESEPKPPSSAVAIDRPPPTTHVGSVWLSPEAQRRAGLQTAPARPTVWRDEFSAAARIVDIQPLLDWRGRWQAALADRQAASVQRDAVRQEHHRKQTLHQDHVVPLRDLQQSHAATRAAEVKHDATRQAVALLRLEAKRQWGDLLGGLLTDGNPLGGYIERRKISLLLLTLPPGQSLPRSIGGITVQALQDEVPRPARYLSPAPFAEYSLQGETHYLTVEGAPWPAGLRLTATIPLTPHVEHAVAIPANAVVLHQGRAWAYVQADVGQFTRRPLDNAVEYHGRWLVPHGIESGEQVVTRGAQLLLSEEARAQIPREDDD